MPRHTLVALYATSTAAERAADDLVNAGIPRSDIDLRSGAADGRTTSAATTSTSAPVGRDEEGGFWGWLFGGDRPQQEVAVYQDTMQQGGTVLAVQAEENRATEVGEILDRHDPIDVDSRAATAAPATAPMATGLAATGGTATRAVDGDAPLQVVEEELRVGKREVAGGKVRVRSYVTERPVEEQVELRQERVSIERRPVDRELRAGDPAFEERTIEMVERGEEAVVSKTARVVEEIAIGKDVERETETVRDTVRRQDVEVDDDRVAGSGLAAGTSATTTDVDVTDERSGTLVEADETVAPVRTGTR